MFQNFKEIMQKKPVKVQKKRKKRQKRHARNRDIGKEKSMKSVQKKSNELCVTQCYMHGVFFPICLSISDQLLNGALVTLNR